MKKFLFLAVFLVSACDSLGGGGNVPGAKISSVEGGVSLAELYNSSYEFCENHYGLNMLAAYEYQNLLITKKIYLGGHAKNVCNRDQMTLVYIESKLLSFEGDKEVSWSSGIAPPRRDASGALPDMVLATKIKSTVTAFKIMSQTLFDSAGFYDTTGYEYKNILYVDDTSVPDIVYMGYGGSGYDADGFENLLLPSGFSSEDMFAIM